MVRELERNPGKTHEDCPNYRVKRPIGDHSRRSISPWRYRIHVDENRFPKKLAYAECLCSGCIDPKDGTENLSMNSVPVEQTMMVLKRIDCPHRKLNERKYTYVVEYIKVPVACTCVIPKTHS
ncbi:IL17C protein, partial [Atractosteus spatula]|nr:IL17C protein [Atractosteus spatula]